MPDFTFNSFIFTTLEVWRRLFGGKNMVRLLLLLGCSVTPFLATADDFIPQPLTINAPEVIQYAFDGAELQIPVGVTGTPARVIFSVFTKGKADQINHLQNGYLGWHYVDQIDTCVYFSPPYDFQPGINTVTWSGQTHVTYMQEGNGGPVGADEYSYYLWGYDNVNPRVRAVPPVAQGNMVSMIVDETPSGEPLNRPFFTGQVSNTRHNPSWSNYTYYKYLLGNDPQNSTIVETCFFGNTFGDQWTQENNTVGQLAWDDSDFTVCYHKRDSYTFDRAAVWKMMWVPNGSAIRDVSWGENLEWDAKIYRWSGMSTDGTYLYTFTHDQFENVEKSVRAYIIDKETGAMLYDFFHEDWIDIEGYNQGHSMYANGSGPSYHQVRNGYLWAGNFQCLKQMLDPHRYMETGDYTDYKRWTNKNGDWISDSEWQPTSNLKWACFSESPPKNRSFDPDHLNWVVNMVGSYGTVSFSLFAPDGTGIGYFSVNGDSQRSMGFADQCDTGSIYDGLYIDNQGSNDNDEKYGFFYIASDSFMGTITEGESEPQPTLPTMAISCPEVSYADSTFQVDIDVRDVTDLFGASFLLRWSNGEYIDFVQAEQGDFLGDDVIFFPVPDEPGNSLAIGVSRKAGQGVVSGSGTIARIRFKAGATTPDNTTVTFTLSEMNGTRSDGSTISLISEPSSITIHKYILVNVWPGDTNNNGTVNQADILPLGLYWRFTNHARLNRSNTWTRQICYAWNPMAATHADADGNGIVNQSDVLVIGLNWGYTHSAARMNTGSRKALSSNGMIQPESNIGIPIQAETEFNVDINVTDVDDLFGVSFVLSHVNASLEPVAAEAGTLMGSDVVFFWYPDQSSSTVAVGISRKAGSTGASGSGTITRIRFRATEPVQSSFTLRLTDISALKSTGATYEITPRDVVIGGSTGADEPTHPLEYDLLPNYPNPFNPVTSIRYSLAASGPVRLDIINIAGQVVRTIVDEHQQQGWHTFTWDGRDGRGQTVSAGVYLYRIQAGTFTQSRKMLFMP